MSYTKTVWVNNSEPSINAENLNKLEQGIADAQFPDGGSVGQALVKTANGQAWADMIAEGSIATVQGATASRNFSAGEYIVRNGTLYKVTTAVSSGTTWGSGNSTQTSVGDEVRGIRTTISGINNSIVGLSADIADANSDILNLKDKTVFQEIPLTVDTTKVTVNGNVKCYKFGQVVFISFNNLTFPNIGGNFIGITGVPKPIAQVSCNSPKGSSLNDTRLIFANTAYIPAGTSSVIFTIMSNPEVRHWMNAVYLTTD